ncbi:OmpA/MotB domain protein [Emticicia oligotrophica DSM 17448]|uniref:OmpA/MotB domain protein n=1 Tax=Emticicia oligotrophica (strain DSM 17448 / CIP 109782 / MTCC 6937 / GPTSA100-15) TaxID=929562 RepID=A0ABM5N5L4_EMTOG|nr:OmpA family protein [Emticicia oligotrophica]AFK04791.1 OmpA/MotB domain protein [Emticicia oligotrophica DSM 17448]
MNRLFLPLLILLWALLYTGWWNCSRKPLCSGEPVAVGGDLTENTVSPPTIDSTKVADTVKTEVPKASTPEEQILFTPLDVYFNVNQSGISKTPEIEKFIETAKKYFEKNPNKQLIITGHSDSDGSDELNQKLSENRSKKVKEFLIQEGLKAEQIITEGKGEKEPIASNDTPEGKKQNRRSTVRLKE